MQKNLKELFENLPPMLKELTEWCDDPHERVLVLISILVVLGGCFTGLKGTYRKDEIYTNLFAFICAPPASGKGRAKYARSLALRCHEKVKAGNEEKSARYQLDFKDWAKKARKSKDTAGVPPKKPKLPILLSPSNVSASALIQHLYDADGKLIFFESEADTLSNVLNQDWGNFSDILRKSFHNETVSISRKGDNLFLEVEKPKLAIFLTGTPDQLKTLFKKDNGLYSRFIIYGFKKELNWEGLSPSEDSSDPEKLFLRYSEAVAEIKNQLDTGEYSFHLTKNQDKAWNKKFEEIVEKYKGDGVSNEKNGIIYRSSAICYKIAMVLTVIRNMDNLANKKELVCADQDIDTVLCLAETFIYQSLEWDTQSSMSSNDQSTRMKKVFYDKLPEGVFSREQADNVGVKIGISTRSVGYYLQDFINETLVEKVSHGRYKRVVDQVQ